jgi:hypothetical protein
MRSVAGCNANFQKTLMRLMGLKIIGFWPTIWLRRWRERDNRHLFKAAAPLPVDPVEELIRVVNEAQERDAEDERRLYHPMPRGRASSYQRRRPHRR